MKAPAKSDSRLHWVFTALLLSMASALATHAVASPQPAPLLPGRCGDGICQKSLQENFFTCPIDCRYPD